MAPRRSKKLQAKELEEQRRDKRVEFERSCLEEEKFWIEIGFDKRFPFNRDECIERKLEEWERTLRKVPTGKYRDPAQLQSEYQQKFIWQIQQLAPHVFNQLRSLVPIFDEFFGAFGDKYNLLFNRYKEEFFHLDEEFNRTMSFRVLESEILDFRPDRYRNWRPDYMWGEYEILLRVLSLRHDTDQLNNQEIRLAALKLIGDGTTVHSYLIPDGFDLAKIEAYEKSQAALALDRLLSPDFDPYFWQRAREGMKQFFQEVFGDEEPDFASFLKLQVTLLTWAERYNLKKDWILRYAYYFILTFRSNPELEIESIDVPYLHSWSLIAQPFEFKFESWQVWRDRKEDYEMRLRQQFNFELTNHFHNVSVGLRLDEQKRRTKPPNFGRLKWLVYATVFGLQKPEQILDRLAEESDDGESPSLSSIYKAFNEFKNFDLPVPD